jgi:hypothetical protein
MKTLKYILVTVGILTLAASAWAVDADQIVAKRQQAATLPASDSVILYHGTVFTIYGDGRMDREEHIFRYLRNLNAWDEFGDPHLAYHSGRQELDVQISRTHTTDGRKVDTTPNGFNPIVPFGLDRAPDFTDYRQMVVTHLGIEHDVVTELKYVVKDTEPFYPWAWGEVLFGTHEPTQERVVTVHAPLNAGLSIASGNGAPEGVKSVKGETESVTWRMTDLPSRDFAEAGDHSGRFLPKAAFSSCPGWDVFIAELGNRFSSAANLNGSLLADIAEIREINDDGMRLDAVIEFISDRIGVKRFDDMGMLLGFRSADQIYTTGYASAADMAVIYAAVLKELGFDQKVFLLGSTSMLVPGVTGDETYSIHLENEPLSCRVCPVSGSIDYLPPYGSVYLGVMPTAEPGKVEKLAYQKNRVRIDMDVSFDAEGGAEGWILAKTYGQASMIDAAVSDGAAGIVEHLTGGLFAKPAVSNATLLIQEREKVAAKADLSFEAADNTVENMLSIVMPWSPSDFHGIIPGGMEFYQAKRDVPVYLGYAGSIDLSLTFNLPEDWDIELIPTAISESVDGLSVERTVLNDGSTVTFNETITLQKSNMPVENWDAFRKLMQKVNKRQTRTLLVGT